MAEAIEFQAWEDTGLQLKKSTGQEKVICPKCSHLRKPANRREPVVQVNHDDKVFNCKNCGWHGYVRRLPKREDKRYERPRYEPHPVSEKMKAWFQGKRKINEQTLAKFLIFPNRKWIAKAGQEVDTIGFPYVEHGQVVNIKSRYDYIELGENGEKVHNKTFTLEKGAKKLLYNVDAVRGQKKVVIVEGEIDCMSVDQAGFGAVCSVPNGAPPLSTDPETKQPLPMERQPHVNLDYLEDATEVFAHAEEIIIATDGDEVGIRLRNEIARRLGKARCRFINWPEGYKDFNQILVDYDEGAVLQVLEEYVEAFPVEGVLRAEDVSDDIDFIYDHGFPRGKAISHKKLSELITFRGGEVTTITGIPGHGKSEAVDEILVDLAQLHGWSNVIFAGENGGPALHSVRLIHRYIRKPVVEDIQKNLFPRMSREELLMGKVWVNTFFNFMDLKKVGQSLDNILDKARELVVNRGVKVLVIDPWNYLESNRPQWQTETEYVSEAYSKLVFFAEEHDVHVIVVAHPTKMSQDENGNFKIPTLYSIAGSANFYNKTFNGVVIYREGHLTTWYVQKVKFDFIGHTGYQEFTYNAYQRRYSEV